MEPPLTLRPVQADDTSFLFRVFSSTRQQELEASGWSCAQIEALLTMQFHAQTTHYRQQYPDADFSVVLLAAHPIGRLTIHRSASEMRIVDIALLPEHRDAGIGTKLLRAVQAEAQALGKRVMLHVEHNNRAGSLYRRLGFVSVGDTGVYMLMEWVPEGIAKP